jgi:hypothetical protein
MFNVPLEHKISEYQCQFRLNNEQELVFYTNAVVINDKILKCFPPVLNNMNQGTMKCS